MKRWGICPNGHWGEAPARFDPRIHNLGCERCGELAFVSADPTEAGYREKDRTDMTPRLMKEKP
jgi:hypothetical protein